jgi:hypothetical protein
MLLISRLGNKPRPHRGREYRRAHPAARSQFLRSCFNVSYDTAAAGADSNLFGADILDTALDRAVSGATSWQIKRTLQMVIWFYLPKVKVGFIIANGPLRRTE